MTFSLTGEEFLNDVRPLLADPDTTIEDGKFHALAEGGGFSISGGGFQLHGEAQGNITLLVMLAWLNHDRVIPINYDKNCFLSNTDAGQYPLLMAAIADFYGIRHNFNRDKYAHHYQAKAQRVYGALRQIHPGYTPPARLYRHPGFWLSDALKVAFFIYLMMSIIYLFGDHYGQKWAFPLLILRTFPWGFLLIFGGYALDHFLSWWHYDAPRPRPASGNPPPAPPSQPSSLPDGIWLGGIDEEPPPPPPSTPRGPAPRGIPGAGSNPRPQPPAAQASEPEPPLLPVTPMARMDERQQAILLEITEVAKLLDSAFNIPIINKSFGIDPLLGMVWGLGDAVSFLPATYIILRSTSLGLPSYKLVRMLRNMLIDTGIGLIPLVGQATDFFIKANIANLNVIHDHFGLPPYKRPR